MRQHAALGAGGSFRNSIFLFVKDRPQRPPQGTTSRQSQTAINRQPPPTTNHQPPPTASGDQPPPTTNHRQPPPTATNRQSPTANRHYPPTANRQSPPTMVEHMSYTRSFCKNAVQEHFFFPLKDPPDWEGGLSLAGTPHSPIFAPGGPQAEGAVWRAEDLDPRYSISRMSNALLYAGVGGGACNRGQQAPLTRSCAVGPGRYRYRRTVGCCRRQW